jgi:prepilin-type N-terminal cleavage/methylation domain-containing protein
VKKNTKGFTLAEVLVAVVIGVISVAAAFSAYNYYTKSYEAVSQKANVNSAARDALILITKDLRNAGFIGTSFLNANCENLDSRTARLNLASVSSKRPGLSGRYGQSDFLAVWYAVSPQDRKRVFYWLVKKQNSNEYFLARDVVINPNGHSRAGCPGWNNNYNHPVDTELLVSHVEDFQVIFKDKDGKVLVPACSTSCGPEEVKQGWLQIVATSYGNMNKGQANQQNIHSADIYLTVRSPKEVYNSNRSFRIVNGEAGYGSNISVSADKYYRETFFASVHTRNLSIPQVPTANNAGSIGEGQGYNK